MSESPRVADFINAKQDQVLAKAVVALDSASDEQLPGEVHRLIGTLGTYGLSDAVDLLRPLDELLKSGSDERGATEQERAAALAGLRGIVSARGSEQS